MTLVHMNEVDCYFLYFYIFLLEVYEHMISSLKGMSDYLKNKA